MSDIFLSHSPADAGRAAAIADALRGAGHAVEAGQRASAGAPPRPTVVLWSRASVADDGDHAVLDEAEAAKARGDYLGVLIDDVPLPFGFGGHAPVDIAPFREGGDASRTSLLAAVRTFTETGQAPVAALPPPPPPPVDRSRQKTIALLTAVLIVVAGAVGYFLYRSAQPTRGEIIEAQLGQTPCAWLRVDPVRDGEDGTLGLTGVAGDPPAAGAAVLRIAQAGDPGVRAVSTTKVARIDPRECAAIDAPRRLRRSPGGRLLVTGEPFILDTAIKPRPQALVRVQLTLDPADRTVALFGVEPSGVVTWALPDRASLEALKTADVGLTSTAPDRYEFSIYPDHLGWTGLFLVVGDRPLAVTKPQGTVQSARDFAATLRRATAEGAWDADMTWFRIDPK